MGRRQSKNTLNNRKTNMTPPESRDSTPARSEKPNTEDEEEMDLKNYLRKMIEIFKEETRKSLKEIEEKTSKKLHEMEEKTNQRIQEVNKSLKESKESQEKTTKQVKEALKTVQGMKAEIDTIKKTQTQNEGMLELERLDKQSGTKDVSITNRIQVMEERISVVEDSLEDIQSSTKEVQKIPNTKYPGNMGHCEKAKPKNNRYRRRSVAYWLAVDFFICLHLFLEEGSSFSGVMDYRHMPKVVLQDLEAFIDLFHTLLKTWKCNGKPTCRVPSYTLEYGSSEYMPD
ncbi:Transposase, L1 containing protein [Cricetulus griseus]|uniref:Transposase, L1 containing protein n=1 Tax=Cricetulus griseus TaxID=10029 RepID=A0A061IMT5_CRIGR|nr:Transposase, L1 containing protein [Cricetulus griseus]